MAGTFSLINQARLRPIKRQLRAINRLASKYAAMSDEDLRAQTDRLKSRLAQGASLDEILPEAFALVREADKRILGMFPYDVQVMGGIALHKGMIAEMKTGEGKTLTATMPLYLNALTGKGAILVTTNDYLAKRDAAEMGPVYEFLGLRVAVGVFDEHVEPTAEDRKAVYTADITYTTSAALGFDYLTNNLVADKAEKFLTPFNYVIVDEADAVLLDNAQMPLIISGSPRVQSNLYDACYQFIRILKEKQDFYLNVDEKVVFLTEAGSRYAEKYFDIPDLYDHQYWELNRHLNLALRAQYLFQKNRDYVVQDDEVKLIDLRTGRILEGTRLQSGIHQALETKEQVPKTQETRSMGTVTFQSLFNMFPKLSGMTGTGKIAEDELIATYRVPVVVIPTHAKVRRKDYPDKIYLTLTDKVMATMEMVKQLHAKGQPILLISGSVEITDVYSKMLLQEGIAHNTLTANNVAKEALIIQEAGHKGNVTVATVMAGRGTDIKLGPGVAELGGLAVLGTERMNNSRMDWQLRGRAGRQGDPGLSQFFVSLEDELFVQNGPKWVNRYVAAKQGQQTKPGKQLKRGRYKRAIKQAQAKSDDKAVGARFSTIQFDESMRVQREKVYALRDQMMLNDAAMGQEIDAIVTQVIAAYLKAHPHRTKATLRRYILDNYSYRFSQFPEDFDFNSDQAVHDLLWSLYQAELAEKASLLETEARLTEFFRLSLLKAIDTCWIEQVDSLQQLKGVVSTRQIGQRVGIYEYYEESLATYQDLGEQIKKLALRHIMLSSIETDPQGQPSIYFV